jgi:hypothetical protein
MAFIILTDGKEEKARTKINSVEELDGLNQAALASPEFAGFTWFLEEFLESIPQGTKLISQDILNRIRYDVQARDGSGFKKGEDYRNEDDDFASYVIDQTKPNHACKIVVVGDPDLRDLIMLLLIRHLNGPATGTKREGIDGTANQPR